MAIGPQKADIEAVFQRLRALPTNKTCFDCNAKNPTWATVTYGVFICIDCSAVHRSLGVHLTFVRSTNLDTNWTWLQLRSMQLGGNANASQFFRQHNCITTDAQQKYNSRAAQLYRDKLSTAAQQAMKVHGTQLHIDSAQEASDTNKKDEDFFAECENDNSDAFSLSNNNYETPAAVSKPVVKPEPTLNDIPLIGAPSVDLLGSITPTEPIKSTIGVRKIQPKRTGLAGAKKGGLGATKVKTNFADIEQRANLSDQHKELAPEKKLTVEEEAETIASVRLAYQDLSMKANQEEEKLKRIDPAKAKQMERLGMGFNHKSGVSHSALTDMKTITQEASPKFSTKTYEKEPKDDFFDDYSTLYSAPSKRDHELDIMGFETIEPINSNSNVSTMFSPTPSKSRNIADQPTSRSNTKVTPGGTKYTTYDNEDSAQKKFGAAKGFGSDQFFNTEASSFERSANLAKFQGSNSISSADYFGDGPSGGRNDSRGYRGPSYSGPDLDDVKESVRQGVTKVAGRLSTMANDMMSSFQDKYGG